MPSHKDATNADMHKIGITASADPGAVGAGVVWHDTDTNEVWVRNAANSGWVELTGGGAGGNVATDTIWDAKGDLAGGTGANTAQKLTVGSNDSILMADSGQTTGLKWVAAGTPSAIDASGGAGSADTFARGDHTHLHEAAHLAHDTAWAAKGDILAGTANDTASVLTAGANDTILMADAAQATGLKWVAPATPVAVGTANDAGTSDDFARGAHVHAHEAAHINHDTTWAAKGDLIAATANDTAQVLGVGSNDAILMADSAQTTGLKWVSPAATPSTQAFGDAAAGGSADDFTRGDHKHAMPANPVTAHEADTTDAHDATAISLVDALSNFTVPNVEVGLEESMAMATEAYTQATDHKDDTVGAHAASAIAFTPHGSIAATNVQAAIQEVRDEAGSGGLTDHTHEVTGSGATGGGGTVKPATLILPNSAAPTPTTEGDLQWDNNDHLMIVGTSGGTSYFAPLDSTNPSPQAFGDAAAPGSAVVSARRDHKHAMPSLGTGATDAAAGNDARLPTSGEKTWLTNGLAGQIAFPASQNASANANTLDDYEEGTFTPAITFATVGNLSVAYSTQGGVYLKIGTFVYIKGHADTSTWTHTTASGNFRCTGLPFAATGAWYLNLSATGWTKASYTNLQGNVITVQSYFEVVATGSAQALATLTTADWPTGGSGVKLRFFGFYSV